MSKVINTVGGGSSSGGAWAVLWTNPDPTASFTAQTIQTTGLSNYRFVAIIVVAGTNVASTKVGTAIIFPFINGRTVSIYGSLFGSSSQRDCVLASDSIAIGNRQDNNNAYLIPTEVYGIP